MSTLTLTHLNRLQQLGIEMISSVVRWSAVSVVVGVLAAVGALTGVSANLLFFALVSLGFAIALSTSLRNATFYSLVFLCFKPALLRLAYHLDSLNASQPTVDLFRFSAGLYLSVLCLIVIAKRLLENRRLIQSKLDLVIALFIGVYAISIVNPHNSVLAGLAGFERNIFPTVVVFFLAGEVIKTKTDITALFKIITVTALLTTLYGLKHAFTGLWGFETTAFNDMFAQRGFDGWLTIGIKGVEFRTFSTFYGYMEFTFTLALWGILLLGDRVKHLSGAWRTLRWMTALAMIVLLAISLERTPMLMIIGGLLTAWYIRSEMRKRKTIVAVSVILLLTLVSGITVFERQLEETGVAKLERIAELSDPSKASSIQDRIDRMWKPTLRIIAANPLGVGAGYGSQTIATHAPAGTGLQSQPHNELLQKALEAGWLGAALFGAIMVMLFRQLKRQSETASDDSIKRFAALGCGVVVAFALCGQINLPFSGPEGIFFWFISGAIIHVAYRYQTIATERDKPVEAPA